MNLTQVCLRLFSLSFLLLILSFLLLAPLPTLAQSGSPEDSATAIETPTQVPSRLDADAISSEKLTQFVQAYLSVIELLDQREGELQATETESESVRLQQEIEKDALKVIETVGLTLQEYLQLLGLANIDGEFSERVITQLQENSALLHPSKPSK